VAANQRFCPKCALRLFPKRHSVRDVVARLFRLYRHPRPWCLHLCVLLVSVGTTVNTSMAMAIVVVRHWDSPGRVCATGTHFAARLELNVVAPWWPRAVDRPAVASRNQSSACRRRASVKRAEVKATLIAAMTWPV